MLSLKQFRSKAAGLCDLINYAALTDEGIVIGKDGSLLGGFFFRGEDAAVATPAERNYITAQLNAYLSRFGAGWAIWVEASRVDAPGYPPPETSHFPDPISAMIDAERRAAFERSDTHYESDYALLIQYLPPLRRQSRIADLIYDDDDRSKGDPGARHIAEFKKRLDDLGDAFRDTLNMRRMGTRRIGGANGYDSDELVNYLHFALTGEPISLRIPDCPMYLDSWLGYPDLWVGNTPKLGGRYVACVTIDGFPGWTEPGLLDVLDGLPLSYRWSSRFIFLDQHEAEGMLKRFRLKWQQKVRGFWSQIVKSQRGLVDTDALRMVQESEEAIAESRSGTVAYGHYTPVVVLLHENRDILDEQARYVRREIERRGFSARVETINTVEAWLGSLPGQTYPNVRRPLIHTLNLADLLPLSSVWPGLRQNPCNLYPPGSPPLMHTVTTGATPFRLNLHVDDVGHTLVFGPTGAGKSTLLATLHTQARRYRDMTVVAFDKGRSLYALCSATGGAHYDLGSDARALALAPLADIDGHAGLLWAQDWLETCYQLQAGKTATPAQRNAITHALSLLQKAPVDRRSITHFTTTVQDAEMREALKHYTLAGAMGHILDGQTSDVRLASYTVFEIDELMQLGEANAIPVLLCLFRQFEQQLDGQPALLSLDEAWVMLGHPVFRDRIRTWLKELRKQNCAVVLATQSLSDAHSSGLLDVLLEQCPTKILLPNKEADLRGGGGTLGPADLYHGFGLNDREIELLKTAQYKRHYYYRSPLGRRIFELGLGPVALSFVAVSDKASIARVRALQHDHGTDWPLAWMTERGVSYEPYTR